MIFKEIIEYLNFKLLRKICIYLLLVGSIFLNAQKFQLPNNYTVVKKIQGDLDKDGIEETVLVCNNNQTNDPKESFARKL